MSGSWRRFVLAAVLNLTVGAGFVCAQTVLVRKAPPGSTVELVFNLTPAGTATVGTDGEGKLTLDPALHPGKTETDARVFVDVCDTVRRVTLTERGVLPPAPEGSCQRTEVGQFVLLRPETTIVVDLGKVAPAMWVSQGPPPKSWLEELEASSSEDKPMRPSPKGPVFFGGAGLGSLSNAVGVSCGNTECEGDSSGMAYTFGFDFWVTRFLAVDAAYLKPAKVPAQGSGTSYSFESSLDTRLFIVAARPAVPIGPVRIYGRAGFNYHRALFKTTETFEDQTITVDGAEQVIPGGTQVFDIETRGWSWVLGGGLEGWVSPKFALYFDVDYANLKGEARGGASGELDDRVTSITGGIRISIGG